jgi:hypothetical protein
MLGFGAVHVRSCNCSGWGTASRSNKTYLATVKIATFAPIPSASEHVITAINPGDLMRVRVA